MSEQKKQKVEAEAVAGDNIKKKEAETTTLSQKEQKPEENIKDKDASISGSAKGVKLGLL